MYISKPFLLESSFFYLSQIENCMMEYYLLFIANIILFNYTEIVSDKQF